MKVALSQVLKLPKFFEELSEKKLSVQILYNIFKLKQKAEEAIEFYQENIKKIISDCAIYDENGCQKIDEEGRVLISKNHVDECTKRIQELMECLVEFPDISFDIKDFDSVILTLEGFEAILPFIKN